MVVTQFSMGLRISIRGPAVSGWFRVKRSGRPGSTARYNAATPAGVALIPLLSRSAAITVCAKERSPNTKSKPVPIVVDPVFLVGGVDEVLT